MNDKNDILAGVIQQGKQFKAVVWRNGGYIDFDGFPDRSSAVSFAEKSQRR